jgi:RIO-like serine/threonine protein kinase
VAIVPVSTEGKALEPRHTPGIESQASEPIELKRDVFGAVVLDSDAARIVRDFSAAPRWLRWLAVRLARREARVLSHLEDCSFCPTLVLLTRMRLERTYLPGEPLYLARFAPREYFRDALRKLRLLHAHAVVHNDLAKEANWICMPGNRAGIVDFQIAAIFERRGRIFRLLAREDLRHLLKHKAHYAPDLLTARQKTMLAQPAWTARTWRAVFKPLYRLITRRLLGWQERTGAVERRI